MMYFLILVTMILVYIISVSKRDHLRPPDSKVHGANMGPIWGRQGSRGPHVGPINFAIWAQWTKSRNHTMSQLIGIFDVERVQAISYEIMCIYIYVLHVKYEILWITNLVGIKRKLKCAMVYNSKRNNKFLHVMNHRASNIVTHVDPIITFLHQTDP